MDEFSKSWGDISRQVNGGYADELLTRPTLANSITFKDVSSVSQSQRVIPAKAGIQLNNSDAFSQI